METDLDRIRQSKRYRKALESVRLAISYKKPQTLEQAIAQLLLADCCAEEALRPEVQGYARAAPLA